jgi:hypothetical protein
MLHHRNMPPPKLPCPFKGLKREGVHKVVSVEQEFFFRLSQTLDCRIDHSEHNMRRAGVK